MMRNDIAKKNAAAFGYLTAAGLAAGSWLVMFAGGDSASLLSSRGIMALKYFTVDSNLLMAAAAIIRTAAARRGNPSASVKSFLLAGTTSVTLTFLTVVFFLGPLYGFKAMFAGSNLYLHLIVPVLSIALLILTRGCEGLPFSHIWVCTLPTLIYGFCYLLNVMRNGEDQDWYGFARGGRGTYLPVFMFFTAVSFLAAFLLWLLSGGRRKS